MTLTPALLQDPPAVELVASELTATPAGNTVTLTRSQEGTQVPVRGAVNVAVTGPDMAWTDYEAGFGTDLVYTTTVTSAAGVVLQVQTSSAVQLDPGGQVWLSDPLDPGSATVVLPELRTLATWELTRDGGALTVLGGAERVAVTGIRHAPEAVPLALLCQSSAEVEAVSRVLMQADPFLLRTPPDRPGPRGAFYSADRITRENLLYRRGDVVVVFVMTAVQVRRPSVDVVVPLRTYAELGGEVSTYSAMLTSYAPPTYLSVQRGSR